MAPKLDGHPSLRKQCEELLLRLFSHENVELKGYVEEHQFMNLTNYIIKWTLINGIIEQCDLSFGGKQNGTLFQLSDGRYDIHIQIVCNEWQQK